jgi:adenosylhomocysteine nucleosidase
MKSAYLAMSLIFLCVGAIDEPIHAAEILDRTPRTAVMSAFEPEWTALKAMLSGREDHVVNGTVFATGTIEHQPVVLFLSGISMVNAAMSTQVALDRFTIKRIVFSGIAGGVNPDLEIGDVVVPDEWSQYLEAVFARENAGSYTLPGYAQKTLTNFGMIFPQPVQIATGGHEPEKRLWFPVDTQLLAIARTAAGTVVLKDCTCTRPSMPVCSIWKVLRQRMSPMRTKHRSSHFEACQTWPAVEAVRTKWEHSFNWHRTTLQRSSESF